MPQNINKFWSFKKTTNSKGQNIGELYIYGDISSTTWWGDEVTPKMFREELTALGDVKELNVHIASSGGDVFAGTAIHSMLMQYPKTVNAYIEGIAASIATVIPMAADNIYISRTAMMMVHNAMAGMMGYFNAHELSSVVAELEKIREPILTAYTDKTGKTREEIISILDGVDKQGTWFTAAEAIEYGLADGYIPSEQDDTDTISQIMPGVYSIKNHFIDLTRYPNAPELGAKNTSERKKEKMSKGFFNKSKKKSPKAQKKRTTKAGLYDVVCPHCGAGFQHDSGDEEGVITITCPDCGEEFEWNTETESVEEDGSTEARRRTKNSKKSSGRKASRSFRNATISVTCPECDAVFDVDTTEDAVVIAVTCEECGAEFDWEVDVESPVTEIITEEDEDDDNGETQDSYNRGIRAERQRISGLDNLQAAFPESANIVAMAKTKGWTVNQATQRVIAARAAKNKGSGSNASSYLDNMRKDAGAVPPLGNAYAPKNSGSNDEISQRVARLNSRRG